MSLGKPENEGRIENGLIDAEGLQQLQDQFCHTNHLYLVCLGKEEGVITRTYGSASERKYLQSVVDQASYMQLVSRIESESIETMIEQPVEKEYVKACAISTKIEGKVQIVWVVIAILEDYITPEDEIPEDIMTTSEDNLYASLEFLSVLSKQLFEIRINQLLAQSAMKKSIESKEAMEKQLERSNAMTSVLKILESDNGFTKLVEDVIQDTCVSIGISGGFLIGENVVDRSLDMLCEYVEDDSYSMIAGFQHVKREEVPFFTDKPYVISCDSMYPEAFVNFLKKYHMSAAIFQPIESNGKVLMYLGFFENDEQRIWTTEDIQFISSVKQVIQSVLVRRIAKNSLASSYNSLEAILENTGCGIYVVDYHSCSLLYTNQKFKQLFAKSIESKTIGNRIFSSREMRRKCYYEEVYFAEEDRWLDVRKTEIDWVDGRKVCLCTLYDITDKKKYQREIENQANNDFLTGLYNRMRCEQDLGKYITKAQSVDGDGVLLYLDLDDFKHINDGLGHQYGDVLLKAISHSIQRIRGIERTCYRMGGDEFIVIIPHNVSSQMDRIVKEILSIFTKPWFLKGEDYYCTVSMGVVLFPSDGNSVEDLMRKADIALLAAKKRGKNYIEYYNDKDATTSCRRLDLEKNMRSAAMDACSEFEVYYQPIINAEADGMPCCGAEALVRWNSKALGFINPDDFIPLAEYLGLINPIGEYVLRKAAGRCRYWNDMGHPDYKVNVNLSVVQLLQNNIVKVVAQVLEDTHINPKNLTLEVTESLAINDMDRMKRILGEIKELGVKVALDDFGTGYSSLNHIREMPLDVIKIDKCFIEHLGEDKFSNAFVKMVSELAKTIGVNVCVEGVETKMQCSIVHDMHIKMIQGYYFGKPMKIDEFEEKYL